MTLPDWTRAYGTPVCAGRIRSRPEDFVVDELLDIEFTGDGEHDWLKVRKTGANTAWAAGRLARHAGVPERDVGYAGLKDRHAVTTQWFSVRRPGAQGTDWQAFAAEGVEILEMQRHARKLKRGAHRGNAFKIILRCAAGDIGAAAFDERLDRIAEGGVPNYFGEQRFGRDGANVALGEAVIAGRRMSRNKRSIGISALRSLEFNDRLSERVADGTWNRIVEGDTANLDGTGSVFAVDAVTPDIERRCEALDIHPAGELPAIESLGVTASWRALRLRVADLRWQFEDRAVTLQFVLGRGSFATTVLREVVNY